MANTVERLNADIAIVGFGPVGAVLAGLLGRRGLTVVVLEVERDVFSLPRAAHIDHQGLRLLQELGCLDKLLPSMRVNSGMDFVNAARKLLLRVPSDRPNRFCLPASMYFHQPGFDRTIRETVKALPSVRILLATQAVGITRESAGATVHATQVGTGNEIHVSARYVVGCDGARSQMRTWLDIPLHDLNFQEQWLVLDLKLREAVPGLPHHAVHVCDPARPHTVVPMPEPRYRFELMLLPGENPEEMQKPETIARLIAPWIPIGLAEVERAAVYTFRGVVAERWRQGACLLAGDAAHQMPPFLGQGMCSGLRDAGNLAWKLDLVVKGGAPDALLDTYELERKPHVQTIIQAAVDFGRIICTLDPREAAIRDESMLGNGPNDASERSRFGLPQLLPGPLVLDGGGALFVQPEISGSGRRLDDLVGTRFLVLGRTRKALEDAAAWWHQNDLALIATLDELPEPHHWLRKWLDRSHSDVVVVRPDRYVLGQGESLAKLTDAVRDLLRSTPERALARSAGGRPT